MSSANGIHPTEKTPQRPAKAASEANPPGDGYVWKITAHCCRACFGRVLVRETFDRRKVYRCSNCGIEVEGRTEMAICCCGIRLKTGVDAGIRCVTHDNPTPELPAQVVAVQVDVKPRI